jgi:hypothetical protein
MRTIGTDLFPTRRARRRWLAAPLLVGLAALTLSACSKQPEAGNGGAKGAPHGEDKQALAKRKQQSASNLRRIAQSLADYAVESRRLLPAAICDKKTGQPLLSWRVALLPLIGQGALYQQFNLDEPWDGPSNKKLLDRMPPIYAPPGARSGAGAMTYYRGFIAAPNSPVRTAWATEPARDSPFGAWGGRFPGPLTDGTSNIIAVVEAGEPVPWTRPGELDYDARKPLPKLGGLFTDGFHVGLMDGAVLFFRNDIDERSLRAYITANGGEVIDTDRLFDNGLITVAPRGEGKEPR